MDDKSQACLEWWIIFLACLSVIGLPVLGYTMYYFRNIGLWLLVLPFALPYEFLPEILAIAIGSAVIATGIWALRRKLRKGH